jgi:hypothetical protein
VGDHPDREHRLLACSGVSDLTLALQASRDAIADAGLRPSDIDGIVRNDMDLVAHNAPANALGIPDRTFCGINGPGGSAPPAMVGQAVAAILSAHAGARPRDRHDNALVVLHDFESFSVQIGDFDGGAP